MNLRGSIRNTNAASKLIYHPEEFEYPVKVTLHEKKKKRSFEIEIASQVPSNLIEQLVT